MEHGSLVQWREWSVDAFAEAKAQDKPILLDIGAVWCHWCHVMDTGIPGDPLHTGTYSSPEIAALINERFIPIKVDNDRRPDINARYNMGGWPTTAFLTPNGEPLYGETYVAPQRMLGLLQHICDYYTSHRDEIAQRVDGRDAEVRIDSASAPSLGLLSREIVATVVAAIKASFDPIYGGFGSSPKFPQASALEFAVRLYAAEGDAELRHVVEKTLDSMAGGGTYDKYAGGFFRYSTTRDWSVPHFEKMLEDNAQLSRICYAAADSFGEPRFAQVGAGVHGWLLDTMYDAATGAFAGSQDADREEAYYGLPLSERAGMTTPFIDRTAYLDWNAMVVSSFAERFASTGDESARQTAQQTFEFVKEHVWPWHYVSRGVPGGPRRLLGDVTAMLTASLDLAAVADSSEPYLADARAFADILLGSLQDEEDGGFFDLLPDADAVGALARPKKEIASDSAAAAALLRLHVYTGDVGLAQAAERALRPYVGEFRKYSLYAASYAHAVAVALTPPVHIVIVGEAGTDGIMALRSAARRSVLAGAALEQRFANGAGDYPPSPDGSPRAYVCIGTQCRMARTPADLAHMISAS